MASENYPVDDSTSADGRALPDSYARHDGYVAVDPHVLVDNNRSGLLQALTPSAAIGVLVKFRRKDADVGADIGVLANLDGGAVEESAVTTNEDIGGERNVVTVVAGEGRFHDYVLAHSAHA